MKEVTPWNWYRGTYKDNRDQKNFFARFGVTEGRFLTIRTQLEMPEDQKQAFIPDEPAALSPKIWRRSWFKLGDRIILRVISTP